MSDDPLKDCPECSGSLRRVLFPPAVVYKGTGFYTTDYKNAGAAGASSGEPKAETKSEATTETKSESKSETKTESTTPAAKPSS